MTCIRVWFLISFILLITLVFPAFAEAEYSLICEREDFYRVLTEEIEKSEKLIHISIFLYAGEDARKISQKLVEKHKQGVEIRFVGDPTFSAFGALRKDIKTEYDYLTGNGIEVRYFPVALLPAAKDGSKIKTIKHSKVMLFDDKSAIVGGFNITSSEEGNRDYAVLIRGNEVPTLRKMLDDNWKNSVLFGEKPLEYIQEVSSYLKTGNVEYTQTLLDKQSIKQMMLKHISQAKNKINIAVLFFDDPDIVDALIKAGKRGVKIRAMVSQVKLNKYEKFLDFLPVSEMANFYAVDALNNSGIQIKWFKADKKYHQILHSKAMSVDDVFIVGSSNFTVNALERNHELTVAIKDKKLAEHFNKEFQEDWQNNGEKVSFSFTKYLSGKLLLNAKPLRTATENFVLNIIALERILFPD